MCAFACVWLSACRCVRACVREREHPRVKREDLAIFGERPCHGASADSGSADPSMTSAFLLIIPTLVRIIGTFIRILRTMTLVRIIGIFIGIISTYFERGRRRH